MSRRLRELVARQAELQRRCALEREQAAAAGQAIAAGLARLDRGVAIVLRCASNPLVIAAGVGALVLLRRSRSLRGVSTLLGLASTALRVAVPLFQRSDSRHGREPAG